MKDSPFEHIGDIPSSHREDDVFKISIPSLDAKSAMPKQKVSDHSNSAIATRTNVYWRETSPHNVDDDEHWRQLLDPTIGHVKRATVVLPVEMTLNDESEAAPTYSTKQSRLTLYAAFPPPPIILGDSKRSYSVRQINAAKQRLKRHSGFHGAIGVSSASHEKHAYADTTLSLNYRYPNMISLPKVTRPMIGNVHTNLHLGDKKHSVGASLSSLDGKSSICVDVINPICQPVEGVPVKTGIRPPRMDRRSYSISATRDFDWKNAWRIRGLMMLDPLEGAYRRARDSLHLGHFALVLSNIESHQDSMNKSTARVTKDRPKVSLSLGYGRDSSTWYHFPQSGVYLPDVDATRDEVKDPSAYSTSMKIVMKQQLSNSQICHSFIKYRQLGQTLSLGTMFTRTFSSSRFSRLGVGIHHIFNNVWDTTLWEQGKTWWLFQLERGDATFCIPVSFHPHAITSWETCIRLFYASLASLIVDAIVGELFCGATSMIRVKFLQLLLGKDYIDEKKIRESMLDRELRQHRDEERWIHQHIAKACEDAMKQRNSMQKQAERIAKKEEERCGLVIVKAVYGVMDNESCEWIQKQNNSKRTSGSCALDATVQLQFWVSDGSLHMPAVSKKHMLGFYDVLDCVSDEDWILEVPPSSNTKQDVDKQLNIVQRFVPLCKRQCETASERKEGSRDLKVVLSIRYKWEDKLFDVMFYDNEAVELPSHRAKEVLESGLGFA